jgi:chromosome segregation ATPase
VNVLREELEFLRREREAAVEARERAEKAEREFASMSKAYEDLKVEVTTLRPAAQELKRLLQENTELLTVNGRLSAREETLKSEVERQRKENQEATEVSIAATNKAAQELLHQVSLLKAEERGREIELEELKNKLNQHEADTAELANSLREEQKLKRRMLKILKNNGITLKTLPPTGRPTTGSPQQSPRLTYARTAPRRTRN